MRTNRIFRDNVPQHMYQRTQNGGVLFYTLADYLVFYTHFTTTAIHYHLQIMCLCLMVNHIHALVRCPNKTTLSAFVQAYSIHFSTEYNK